jgi:hypothetical protein
LTRSTLPRRAIHDVLEVIHRGVDTVAASKGCWFLLLLLLLLLRLSKSSRPIVCCLTVYLARVVEQAGLGITKLLATNND